MVKKCLLLFHWSFLIAGCDHCLLSFWCAPLRRVWLHLLYNYLLGIGDSNEVSPEPSLKGDKPVFPSFPSFIHAVFQPPICLLALLDLLQNGKGFLVPGRPKLGTILQILHRYQREGKNHFPAGYPLAITAPYTIGFQCCKATLLTHVQPVVHQNAHIFDCKIPVLLCVCNDNKYISEKIFFFAW